MAPRGQSSSAPQASASRVAPYSRPHRSGSVSNTAMPSRSHRERLVWLTLADQAVSQRQGRIPGAAAVPGLLEQPRARGDP